MSESKLDLEIGLKLKEFEFETFANTANEVIRNQRELIKELIEALELEIKNRNDTDWSLSQDPLGGSVLQKAREMGY